MDNEERRDAAGGQREEDPAGFERIGRETREGQSPNVAEEGTEEDRRQWEKTRDLHEEARQVAEKTSERRRRPPEDRDG